jgi:hypothetical protein
MHRQKSAVGTVSMELFQQCSWLRHYVTSRKVPLSISNEVTGFLSLILPAALWPPGPLNLYQKWIPGSNLTAICSQLARKCGSLDVSQACGPPRPVIRIALSSFTLFPDGSSAVLIIPDYSVNVVKKTATAMTLRRVPTLLNLLQHNLPCQSLT